MNLLETQKFELPQSNFPVTKNDVKANSHPTPLSVDRLRVAPNLDDILNESSVDTDGLGSGDFGYEDIEHEVDLSHFTRDYYLQNFNEGQKTGKNHSLPPKQIWDGMSVFDYLSKCEPPLHTKIANISVSGVLRKMQNGSGSRISEDAAQEALLLMIQSPVIFSRIQPKYAVKQISMYAKSVSMNAAHASAKSMLTVARLPASAFRKSADGTPYASFAVMAPAISFETLFHAADNKDDGDAFFGADDMAFEFGSAKKEAESLTELTEGDDLSDSQAIAMYATQIADHIIINSDPYSSVNQITNVIDELALEMQDPDFAFKFNIIKPLFAVFDDIRKDIVIKLLTGEKLDDIASYISEKHKNISVSAAINRIQKVIAELSSYTGARRREELDAL